MNNEVNQNSGSDKSFDPASLVGKTLKELAGMYGISVNTLRRSTQPISKKLKAIKQKIRPGCKRGSRAITEAEAVLYISHLGKPCIK